MSKTFYDYVENRIVENVDYEKLAQIINEHIANKGHVTPEDLQEAWFGIPQMARGVAALGGGLGRMGADLGGRAASAVGSAASAAGQKIGNIAGAAGRQLSSAAGAAKSAAGAATDWAKGHMNAAAAAQAAKQVADRKADLVKNPLFNKLSPADQNMLAGLLDRMSQAR